MCRFIETIQVKNGAILRTEYHNVRMNAIREKYWNAEPLDIRQAMPEISAASETMKLRIVYNAAIAETTLTPYEMRPVRSLKIVRDDNISYAEKREDRSALSALFAQRDACDDVLIVRNGMITDTSIGNVALWDGTNWETPRNPLLRGTMRQFLLDNRMISEADIRESDLPKFSRIRIFNAMIDFGRIEFPTQNIQI